MTATEVETRISGERIVIERRFTYQCWESDDSADADLWHHSGETCEVIRDVICDAEDVGWMYRVRFEDGFEADGFTNELAEQLVDEAVDA